LGERRTRLVAAVSALACALGTALARSAPAAALPLTISLRAQTVNFYPGHLVLDGIGGADLDDGLLHVHADRIIVDLRAARYVAAGSVVIGEGTAARHGDALGVDLTTRKGLLVDTAQVPPDLTVDGPVIGGAADLAPGSEPLALPDIGFEQPYARASAAVAHLGADVRLRNAQIIVPGGESVALPSYVYTFATSPGYSTTNISTGGEDIPIYFASSPVSIQGIHFSYNPISKVGIGLDSHFVWGNKAYVLVGAGPLFGPVKSLNLTWQDQINEHASQTLTSYTTTGFGTVDQYDARDTIHRSFLELDANQGLGAHGATLAWQSFDQHFLNGSSTPFFHLRSEYGYTHVPEQFPFAPFPSDAVLPRTIWHSAFEGYLGSPTWTFGPNVSLTGSVDGRAESDSLPHRQVSQLYTLTLYTRWSSTVSTNFSDSAGPFFDAYPSLQTIYHSRINAQTLAVRYDHGEPFSLSLSLTRARVVSDNPNPPFAYPWYAFADLRFRVTPSFSLELSRSYFFGFNGQRYGPLGLQIFP
jgi:hypothetical protein